MPNSNFKRGGRVLILLCGLPGSGKTTFAKALAQRMPLVHVESDAIRRGIAVRPSYSQLENTLVFARVEAEVRRALADGCIALQDATNVTHRDRRRFLRVAEALGAKLIAVRIVAPEATIRERLAKPRDGHSQAGIEIYERMRPRLELLARPTLVVDTRFSLEPALALVATLAAGAD